MTRWMDHCNLELIFNDSLRFDSIDPCTTLGALIEIRGGRAAMAAICYWPLTFELVYYPRTEARAQLRASSGRAVIIELETV